MNAVWLGIVLATAIVFGCGCSAGEGDDKGGAALNQDGGSGIGDGGSQPQLSSDRQTIQICDAYLAWEKKCAVTEPTLLEEPFWGETECLNGPWRYVQQSYIEGTVACLDSLSCESSDDECTAAGYAAIGVETAADMEAYIVNDALASRCGRIADQCTDLSGDMCFRFVIFTQAGRNAAAPCLDLECSQIESCLDEQG